MAHLGSLTPAVDRFRDARILVIGDIMLDRYVLGRVDRISPEAPIPVLAIADMQSMLGACGNVARNISSLGGHVTLLAVVGDDEEGRELTRLASAEPHIETNFITVGGRATTLKMRFVAGGQQLLRADREIARPIDEETERRLLEVYADELAEAQVVIVSDYAKGVLTPRVLHEVIGKGRAAGIPVIVDPKSEDLLRYDGATLIKPNARELARAAAMPSTTDADAIAAARKVLNGTSINAVLVTRSELGMLLMERDAGPKFFPAEAREVYDVSGAGDTSIASLALGMAAGLDLKDAAALANRAAGVVVGKRGTAVLFPQDLKAALHAAELADAGTKVLELPPALDRVQQWRSAGLSVGFTNGCFDLIHPGHVSLLAEARGQADRLIVGLNTDASVKRLKGPTRPVNSEMARAIVLASLASVDMVVLFDEETPLKLIETFRPDVLIKGADYSVETVIGAPFVLSYGGRIHLAALVPGMSTTKTIEKMTS